MNFTLQGVTNQSVTSQPVTTLVEPANNTTVLSPLDAAQKSLFGLFFPYLWLFLIWLIALVLVLYLGRTGFKDDYERLRKYFRGGNNAPPKQLSKTQTTYKNRWWRWAALLGILVLFILSLAVPSNFLGIILGNIFRALMVVLAITVLLIWQKEFKTDYNSLKGSWALRWGALFILLAVGFSIIINAFIQTSLDLAILIWPAVLIVILLLFRTEIGGFMTRLKSIGLTVGGNTLTFEAAEQGATAGETTVERLAGVAAVGEFGKAGDPKAVETLIDRLRLDAEADVRSAAARKLGQIGDFRAVEPLRTALEDPDPNVKLSAIEALGNTVNKSDVSDKARANAVDSLIKALKGGGSQRCQAAARALGSIGRPAVEPLARVLKDKEIAKETALNVKKRAVFALKRIGEDAEDPLITYGLTADYDEVRREAAYALAHISRIRYLTTYLASDDFQIREGVTIALTRVGGRAVPRLVAILKHSPGLTDQQKDRAERRRKQAKKALVEIGEPAIPPLVDALKDLDADPRYIEETLAEIGKPAVASLIEALKAIALEKQDTQNASKQALSPELERILDTLRLMGAIAVPEQVALLRGLSQDIPIKVKVAIKSKIGDNLREIHDATVITDLVKALGDSEASNEVFLALTEMASITCRNGVLDELQRHLVENICPNEEIRRGVAKALRTIEDASITQLVEDIKDIEGSLKPYNEQKGDAVVCKLIEAIMRIVNDEIADPQRKLELIHDLTEIEKKIKST
ncbi:MAG: HEAT repeat domain-containing protein [Halobacteriota archaeon]